MCIVCEILLQSGSMKTVEMLIIEKDSWNTVSVIPFIPSHASLKIKSYTPGVFIIVGSIRNNSSEINPCHAEKFNVLHFILLTGSIPVIRMFF